eukprot:CAMPEP_0180792844 /NCGR_PEP_ID=MMETSP1038_2-20121128/54647_1 /TAXON_ID=632150 /ORGANISM="Azadinium spinosum, Strain 3D9" /LENGTH=31 /DNA_ID= /DNA_START= /DNA_END= /DNA_ORIENTATION=
MAEQQAFRQYRWSFNKPYANRNGPIERLKNF